jgi:transmembrane sensor
VQRLTAGQHLDVVAREEKPSPPPAEATSSRAPDAVKRVPAPWQELSTRGDYASAYRLLGRRGIDAESTASTKIDELMALGDVARLSGHPSDAISPLSRVVREFSRDPRASLAAFTLGKIRLAAPDGARAAAANFRDALRLGLPETLADDAYGYIVEALRRAGDDDGARSAAFDYARRCPASPRAAALRAWADRR